MGTQAAQRENSNKTIQEPHDAQPVWVVSEENVASRL